MSKTATAVALSTLLASPSMADDLDVYTALINSAAKPNILFVLDYSGSMAEYVSGTSKTRIDVLRHAMANVMGNNRDSLNAGLGSLFEWESTGIKWPVSELTADASTVDADIPAGQFTVEDIINGILSNKSADGSTATLDALVEAAQYFRGDPVTHNDSDIHNAQRHQPARWSSAQGRFTGGHEYASHRASYSPADAYSDTGGNSSEDYGVCYDYSASGGENGCAGYSTFNCVEYNYANYYYYYGDSVYSACEYSNTANWTQPSYTSPIASSCQTNAIVLISDGLPTRANDGQSLYNILGTNQDGCQDLSAMFANNSFATEYGERPSGGNCGPELARFLAENDQVASIANSKVRTFTVGFDIPGAGQDYLDLLAEAGGGESFNANNPAELDIALSEIVSDIIGDSESFASMAINVDRESFSHDNRVFLNMFSPSGRATWNGNLKGYFIDTDGLVDIHGNPATALVNDEIQLAMGAQSFWSSIVDGNDVTLGGASESLQGDGRQLFTYLGATNSSVSGVSLTNASAHRLASSNYNLSAADLGLSSGDPVREQALDWIQTAPMGDALHSRPAIVDYAGRTVVFTMTNQGLLHAIDATDPTVPNGNTAGGEELFAFMPKELLKNLPDLYLNSNKEHIYGLDGQITPWHEDANGNGIVDGNDTLMLVFGMRRGGNHYYALDVTNPLSPKMMWTLSAGDLNLDLLGESWSRMALIPVRHNGSETRVLAFGGGYDAAVLDKQSTRKTSKGNAIYMINRQGQVVWRVDGSRSSKLKYAIPSDLTVIDSNQDGISDRIYVGDLGGQLLRIDFDDIGDGGSGADINVLAYLHDSQNQRFFYPPSVSMETLGGTSFLAVAIGSGDRTDPLNATSNNKIYVIRDTHIDEPLPSGSGPIGLADLYDASENLVQSSIPSIATSARASMQRSDGWYIDLAEGEKSLSSLVAFEGKLMATTFEPDANTSADACSLTNKGRLYIMSTADGTPAAYNTRGKRDRTLTSASDRITALTGAGIPSEPLIMFPAGGSQVQIMVDKDSVNLVNQEIRSVFWYAK